MMHTSLPTDADLLARYLQAGDEGAFTALVRTPGDLARIVVRHDAQICWASRAQEPSAETILSDFHHQRR